MKSVKIFSTIEPYELTKVMDAVKPLEFPAGTTIIKEVIPKHNRIRAKKETFSSCLNLEKLMQQRR